MHYVKVLDLYYPLQVEFFQSPMTDNVSRNVLLGVEKCDADEQNAERENVFKAVCL